MNLPKLNLSGFETLDNFLKGLNDISSPIQMINKGVGLAIGLITSVAFLYFMFLFFTASISWLSAGGDQKKVESAGKQIYNAIIGLILVVAAQAITGIIGKILGLDILNPFGFLLKAWQ